MIKKRWLILLYCLSTLLVLILPVYANPMIPIMTKVFITQNGNPVNDTVDFSLDCFGTEIYGFNDLHKHGIEKALNITEDDDVVYAYTATCRPAEHCIVHKPDTPWMIKISHCDLSGTYKKQPFLLKNFSTEPMSSSVHSVLTLGKQRNNYIITYQAERECYNQRVIRDHACEKFKNKSLETETTSGATPEYWQCGNESVAEYFACIKNNGTWINETEAGEALQYYELQFDIPSDNKNMGTETSPGMLPEIFNNSTIFSINPLSDRSLQLYTVQTVSPAVPRNPVESLFCRILSIFNTSC